MADMAAYTALVKTSERKNVIDFRAELPCDLVSLYAVEYNGMRLPYSGDQTHFNLWCESRTTNMIPNDGDSVEFGVLAGNSAAAEALNESNLMGRILGDRADGASYQINPGYIVTSFETGIIKLHYAKYPTDSEGFPLIPDVEVVKEAMMWYMMKNILMSGYEHPVFRFGDAERRYNSYREEAWVRMRDISVDQAEKMVRTMNRLIPRNYEYENFFMGSHNTERIETRP